MAAHDPTRHPVLFDSAAQGPLGAWTILPIAATPMLWLERDGGLRSRGLPIDAQVGFLATLERWWRAEHHTISTAAQIPGPWRPGWAVWLGYELAREIEPSLRLPASPLPIEAIAVRTPAALLFEHATGRGWGVAEPAEAGLLDLAVRGLEALPAPLSPARAGVLQHDSLREDAPEAFLEAVRAAKEAIAAGEVYQANLSREWTARLAAGVDGTALYERLRRANPAPFAARAQFPGVELLSSSPERLVQITAGVVSTRPIAGTRPRSGDAQLAGAETAALLANAKERAEHVMLIDLERNDLGRVCAAGSVEVSEFMAIESYAHVHHIVSNVRGRLRPELTPIDVLRAVFPGGTITGCPKVRCMALIAELEGRGRGAYTGSLGWLGADGSADFNILIRTLSLQQDRLTFRAGAGIVADSIGELELQETRAKALGLIRALAPTS